MHHRVMSPSNIRNALGYKDVVPVQAVFADTVRCRTLSLTRERGFWKTARTYCCSLCWTGSL